MGPSSLENWRDCACRLCDFKSGGRVAPGVVVMEMSRKVSVRRAPRCLRFCPSICPVRHSLGSSCCQLGQGKLQFIGCTGEYNASMQVGLGASMAERY